MLEYILIHVLVLADWLVQPHIHRFVGKHYVVYPMLLRSVVLYGAAGLLFGGLMIKNEKKKESFLTWCLLLITDLAIEIYRAVYHGVTDSLLVLLIGVLGVNAIAQYNKLFEK